VDTARARKLCSCRCPGKRDLGRLNHSDAGGRGQLSSRRAAARRVGFAPGESATLDIAYWIRLAPREFSAEVESTEWRGVVELLGRWSADDRIGGVSTENGGTAWSAVFGLQANLSRAAALEGGFILPMSDSTESPFGDFRRGFLLSFRLLF
jgi:hypothetical protein